MAQKTVKVKSGDTLSKIAKASGTTVSAIASANKIKDVNKIYSGQSLTIPSSTTSSKVTTKSSGTSKSTSPFQVPGTEPKTKQTGTKSYNQYSMSKPVGSTISSSKKKTGLGKILDAIKTTGSKLLGASAYDGYAENPYTYNDGLMTEVEKTTPFQQPIEDITSAIEKATYQAPKVKISTAPKKVSADEIPSNPSAIDAEGNLYTTYSSNPTDNLYGAEESGISALEPDKVTGSNITPTTTKSLASTASTADTASTDMSASTFSAASNPTIINTINNANNSLGVKSDILNNPWWTKETKGEYQSGDLINYASNVANGFKTPEEAMAYLNTPQGLASIKPFTDKGGKVEDIIGKVKTVTNGIVGPQTFAEFTSKVNDLDATSQDAVNAYVQSKVTGFNPSIINPNSVPSELKSFVDSQNRQSILDSDYLNKTEKMMYEQAYQDGIAAQEERDALDKITNARETAIERKTEIAVKQYKADMKAEEAETEQNRITARKNLTEFLAQIGALRTDGNAQLGIETLDQKYQAQKSSIRAKYNTLIGNLEADADEKISELQYNLQRDTLELYKDLNKSDRELRMDIMKMQYQYQSDVLKANTSYQEKLSDLKIKQSSDYSNLQRDALSAAKTILNNGLISDIQLAKQLGLEIAKGKPSDKALAAYSGIDYSEPMVKMKGPDGLQYEVPESQVSGFISAGGRKL